jgi:hypothetical protein
VPIRRNGLTLCGLKRDFARSGKPRGPTKTFQNKASGQASFRIWQKFLGFGRNSEELAEILRIRQKFSGFCRNFQELVEVLRIWEKFS